MTSAIAPTGVARRARRIRVFSIIGIVLVGDQ
jgi:hypothetical protein